MRLILFFIFPLMFWFSAKALADDARDAVIKELTVLASPEKSAQISVSEIVERSDAEYHRAMSIGAFDLAYEASSIAAFNLSLMGQDADVMTRYQENVDSPYQKDNFKATLRFNWSMMNTYARKEDHENAKVFVRKVEKSLEEDNFSLRNAAFIKTGLGQAYYWLGDYQKGIGYLKSAKENLLELDISEDERERLLLGMDLRIANLYFELEDYEKSLSYYLQGYEHSLNANDKSMIAVYQFNIALAYELMKAWDNSIRYADMAMESNKAVNDLTYYAMSMEIKAKGLRYKGDYLSAVDYENKAINIYRENDNRDNELFAYIQLAMTYLDMGEINQAESLLLKLQALPDEESKTIRKEVDYWMLNYSVFKEIDDYAAALFALEKVRSIESEEVRRREEMKSARLMVEYEVESAAQRNAELEKENQLKTLMLEARQAEEQVQNYKIYSLLGLFVVLGVFILRERGSSARSRKMANTDPLTSIPNRRGIESKVFDALREQEKNATPISLCIVDLDNFKVINDNHGHDVGDMALKHFVKICQSCLRSGDHLGRFGGEEFLLVLPDADKDAATQVFKRCQSALKENPLRVGDEGVEVYMTISMGISTSYTVTGGAGTTLKQRYETMAKTADINVYKAKGAGKDAVFATC